jgi:predicted nucleic-acid-binding protein
MTVLDTSALIRYFTRDNKVKAEKTKLLLETEKELVIPDVVLPEIEYVLIKTSKASRLELIKAFKLLTSLQNISLTKEARGAIITFEKTKLDMADCIIAAYSMKGSLASFDSRLLDIKDINPFWK